MAFAQQAFAARMSETKREGISGPFRALSMSLFQLRQSFLMDASLLRGFEAPSCILVNHLLQHALRACLLSVGGGGGFSTL